LSLAAAKEGKANVGKRAPAGCAGGGVPLGAVPALSWRGEMFLGGIHIIIIIIIASYPMVQVTATPASLGHTAGGPALALTGGENTLGHTVDDSALQDTRGGDCDGSEGGGDGGGGDGGGGKGGGEGGGRDRGGGVPTMGFVTPRFVVLVAGKCRARRNRSGPTEKILTTHRPLISSSSSSRNSRVNPRFTSRERCRCGNAGE